MQILFVLDNGRRSEVDFMDVDEGTTVKRLIQRKGLKWNANGLAVRVNRRTVCADHPLQDGDRITATARPALKPGARVLDHELPPEAEAAASRLGVTEYIPTALELIGKYFSGITSLQFAPSKDPETEEEWLSIEATVEGDIDSVSESFDAYTKEWVARVPWPYASRICLSYNIRA